MRKTIVLILVLLSLFTLAIRFGGKFTGAFLGIKQNAGLAITSIPDGATVFITGEEVGKTPYDDKSLEPKEYEIKITKDLSIWQGRVKLNEGTITIINRELAKDVASSAGEVLSLQKGQGLTIISNPSDSQVEVDGKSYGKSPLTVDVVAGEHTIVVSHANYLKRSIRVNLPDNFNLTVSLDLALSEADLSTISTPPITVTPEVIVKQTPTGFLRVRDKPSLAGQEIARLNPGDKLVLLEEITSWDRVRLSDGREGYVSSSYVEKLKQETP